MGGSEPAEVVPTAPESVLQISMLEAKRDNGFAVVLPTLELNPGDVAALLGPSGCGKSTLLLGMLGLCDGVSCSGTLRFGGVEVPTADRAAWQRYLREQILLVPQDAKAALDPLQTIGTQIRTVTDYDLAACEAALGDLLVEDPDRICGSYPHQVSGGQAQKALLAIALLRQPTLLVADEPSASLDEGSVRELMHNLHLLQERHGTAILFSTHDIWLVGALRARCFVHRDGQFNREHPTSGPWPKPLPAAAAAAAAPAPAPAVAATAPGPFPASIATGPPPAPNPAATSQPAARPGEILLQCKDVRVSLGGHEILRGVNLELCAGEIISIVGPSGCGKTTLARVLSGHLQPDSGWIGGSQHGVQMLFQEAYASLTPHRSIFDLVGETAVPGFQIHAEATRLGLSVDRLAHTAGELSAGQRRRAALLRALSVEPRVLILDEPTASLDQDTASAVMSMVLEVLQRHHLGCLLITHDRSLARAVAHEMLELSEGVLC